MTHPQHPRHLVGSKWTARQPKDRELHWVVAELVPGPLPEPVHLDAHRWRYASPRKPLGVPFLHDEELGLSLWGDGCLGERLESAFLSGVALGERLVGSPSAT